MQIVLGAGPTSELVAAARGAYCIERVFDVETQRH